MTRLSRRWANNQREQRAAEYDDVAEQIESGRLKIRGADPDEVKDRVRDKARRVRDGQHVHRRRTIASRPDKVDE